MGIGRSISMTGSALALFGLVAVGTPAAWAQDATPEAVGGQATEAPRPAHIHAGNCNELGDVVAPLVDLTGGQGDNLGQSRRAIPAESSYTNVPLPLDAILGADHAINVHLSADEIETYIACGEIGGSLTAQGALIVGLGELNDSGFTGVAFLAPGADGASTDVSVFIAETQGNQRDRNRGAEDDTTAGGDETDTAGVGAAATPEGIAIGDATDDAADDATDDTTDDGTPEAGA
jgi:hypothetical protein